MAKLKHVLLTDNGAVPTTLRNAHLLYLQALSQHLISRSHFSQTLADVMASLLFLVAPFSIIPIIPHHLMMMMMMMHISVCNTHFEDSTPKQCENKIHTIKWYHPGCIQLQHIHKNKWLCPTCLAPINLFPDPGEGGHLTRVLSPWEGILNLIDILETPGSGDLTFTG